MFEHTPHVTNDKMRDRDSHVTHLRRRVVFSACVKTLPTWQVTHGGQGKMHVQH